MKHKLLINLIVFFIILISTISVFAENKKYNTYLAIGDSITEGFGLNNREDVFAYKLKEKLEIDDNNYNNMAISGITAEEFNELIRTEKYTKAIKESDLVTISIGSNELLEIIQDIFIDITGITRTQMHDLELFNKLVSEKIMGKTVKDSLKNAYKLIDEFYNRLTSQETESKLNERIEIYKENWINIINYIKETNPEAAIIVAEFYNPYYNMNFIHDFGEVSEKYIKKFNEILYEVSEDESRYKIAKIHDDFNNEDKKITNLTIDLSDFSSISIDPHPNKDGYQLIAERFIEAINREDIQTNNNESANVNLYISIVTMICIVIIILGYIIYKKRKV